MPFSPSPVSLKRQTVRKVETTMLQSRILHVSYVVQFLDHGFDTNEICQILKAEADSIITTLDFDNFDDWEVHFRATYTNGRQLLISKNRFGTYPSDKYKEIIITIPIPTVDKVPWGVASQQHIYEETHYDAIMDNFNVLEVNYAKFRNRTDYILDCMRRAITFSFEHGFTINKARIKISP